ncbi:MAG: transporter substrate-binding domain-containing protein, partial [Burkholderiales bacterium]|nr:transporter substrate-binding domain-containing protein [Burkholderiales bacterium]
MNRYGHVAMFCVLAGASLLLRAQREITLATGERPPYVGAALPEQGYVAEVLREALAREGYKLNLVFYPWARAELEAIHGHTDGELRSASDDELFMSPALLYSDPIPGGITGLLKKKSLPMPRAANDARDARGLLRSLSTYRFGVVRGEVSLPHSAIALQRQEVTDDLQNLDSLDQGNVQLAVIDRLTAADLMVSQRPQLIGKLEFLHVPLAHTPFYAAVSIRKPDHARWLTAINDGLYQLAHDGTLERILNKHGVFPAARGTPGKTRLTIGTVDNHDMVVMRELSKGFEQQHPDIELDWR